MHRCGRTARIGHSGSALVFLLPMEESYVTFLSINQKVSGPGILGLSSTPLRKGMWDVWSVWGAPNPAPLLGNKDPA